MRLLLVEDEAELAALLLAGLRNAGFVVDGVATIADADAATRAGAYDVVVLDRRLPDGDGMDFLRQLRRNNDGTPVLMLTARDAVEDRIDGLQVGADDYVLKPFHMAELVARLWTILRRPSAIRDPILANGDVALDLATRIVTVADHPLTISRREGALLELFLRKLGRVITKPSIESALYGFGEELESNAVEVLVHRLRRRLNTSGASPQIQTLRGIGYLMEPVR
ncbi:response regulator [Brevundimonas sp.]|uniref:response regulator n=1 Tax=Brevundimonas sp. TaxID=1871086 RepID=UPI003BAA0EAB